MSPLLYHISCTIQRDKKCLAEVRRAGWQLTCTWHPLQGPTEMTGKTDIEQSPNGVRKQESVWPASQKVCTNPERQRAEGMKLVEIRGHLKGLYRQTRSTTVSGLWGHHLPTYPGPAFRRAGPASLALFLRCPQSSWQQRGLTLGENPRDTLPASTDISWHFLVRVFLNSSHSTKPPQTPKQTAAWEKSRVMGRTMKSYGTF